ncbi:sensor histidine kinase [Cellulosilyticum sp. I15G10I2]|uniref:sensor histidine kinase n=1 Tax=Cellulosilyticum sp. I15G10I2 TaxID=1892843 RepID=UPI00085C9DE0|nr:sensor histidine kinase [Cellulosilyticum sp. I15G10I2]
MKRTYTFKLKLLGLFFIWIAIPLILMSSLLSLYFNNLFIKQSDELFSNTLYSVSKNLQLYLDELKRLSLSPHVYDEVMEPLIYINSGNYTKGEDQFKKFTMARAYTQSMMKVLYLSRNDVTGVLFMPVNNNDNTSYVIKRMKEGLEEINDYNFKAESWYNEAIKQNGAAIFSPVHEATYYNYAYPMHVFSVVRLIKDTNSKRYVGVIKVDAAENIIRDIFNNISLSPHSVLALLDQNKKVIYSTHEVSQELLQKISENNQIIKSHNDTFYISIEDIPSTPWQLVYMSSRKDVLMQTSTIYYVAVFLGIVCFTLAFMIFQITSQRVVNPVKNIISAMKKMEKGDLEAKVPIDPKSNDEFTIISKALNRMTLKLSHHIDSEYRAVLCQRNAEYIALQTQINPHFLYNTLNGFITLNRLGAKQTLEDSIIQLTALFRYTCSNAYLSTIAEEFSFLDRYLSLQKLRFDDRLSYHITIDETARTHTIPKLLIQPLVENAIIHGMEPSDQPIFIDVYAFTTELPPIGLCTVIIMKDDGLGFDMSSLKKESRVGIKNIEERLHLFRPNSFFEIQSVLDQGTSCHIIIPVEGV